MAVADWNTDPALNTSIGGINIAENCPAGNMNNAVRELMAQFATWLNGGSGFQASDPTLSALAAITTAANQLIYATGPDAFATTALSPFMRGMLNKANGQAVCQEIGALRIAAQSLSSPGYIKFNVGAVFFQIAWGSFTASANGYSGATYASAFPNASFAIASGVGELSPSAQDNNPGVTSCSASGLQVYNASNACNCWYIAVGY